MSGAGSLAGHGGEVERVAVDGFELHVHRDIGDVDSAEWDSLLRAADVQRSHRFIRCCQRARIEDAEYWHVLAYRNGALEAVATLSRMVVKLDVLAGRGTQRVIGGLRRLHARFLELPVLICGLPVSFGQPGIAFRQGADVTRVARAIAWLMERVADRSDTHLLCWKEFDDDLADALQPLCALGYLRAASLPSCSLSIRWRMFDAYVGDMRAGYRRQLQSTLESGRRAGLQLRREENFSREAPVIFRLYDQVIERAEHRLERLNLPFVEALDRELGAESHALMMEHNGRTVAAALMLRSSADATFLLTGIDYSLQRELPLYENLVTEVIREAIASGAARLELGQTSAPLKSRLGAVESHRSIFLRYRGRATHQLLRFLSPRLFPAGSFPARRVFKTPARGEGPPPPP